MTRYEQITRLAAQLDITWAEAETLRRCSMTLSRWAELECGDSNDYQSWAIERDEETNKPYMVHYPHNGKPYRRPIPDMEAGALKRVEAICKANGLHFYHKRTLAVRHCTYLASRLPTQRIRVELRCASETYKLGSRVRLIAGHPETSPRGIRLPQHSRESETAAVRIQATENRGPSGI